MCVALLLIQLDSIELNAFCNYTHHSVNHYRYREEVAKELRSALSHIKLSSEGVYVQASTLGSLEALLEFLRTSKIPVRDCIIIIIVTHKSIVWHSKCVNVETMMI